ncbi:transposase [Candidatus Peregrinibacteria bacterium]|nr:transposase [Candidatus Peregrinibacteria bacterium]
MVLNDAGKMIQSVWDEIPKFYMGIDVDASQIMPNHIHGIILIQNEFAFAVGAGPRACPEISDIHTNTIEKSQNKIEKLYDIIGKSMNAIEQSQNIIGQPMNAIGQPQGVAPTGLKILSLPDIVHRFKTMTTKKYSDGVKNNNWSPFPGKLWQRNYYEHIIRDEDSLNRIREYIQNNPSNWGKDEFFFANP